MKIKNDLQRMTLSQNTAIIGKGLQGIYEIHCNNGMGAGTPNAYFLFHHIELALSS